MILSRWTGITKPRHQAVTAVAALLTILLATSALALNHAEEHDTGVAASGFPCPPGSLTPSFGSEDPLSSLTHTSVSLCAIGLDLPENGAGLDLGLLRRWQPASQVLHFAGLGPSLAAYGTPSPSDPVKLENPSLAVGAWLGAGLYWLNASNVGMGLGFRWSTAKLGASEAEEDGAVLQATASIAMCW